MSASLPIPLLLDPAALRNAAASVARAVVALAIATASPTDTAIPPVPAFSTPPPHRCTARFDRSLSIPLIGIDRH